MGVVETEEKKAAPAAAIEGEFKEQAAANGETAPASALAVREDMAVGVVADPEKIVADARKVASILANVIRSKPKPVIINGNQYLEIEDWAFLGEFYGVTAKTAWTRPYTDNVGRKIGWEAGAIVIRMKDGMELASAEAECLETEEDWGKRPKHEWMSESEANVRGFSGAAIKRRATGRGGEKRVQVQTGEEDVPDGSRRSMAQTRAQSKALAQRLRWIPMLAGFKGTPAEEMPRYQAARDSGGGYDGGDEPLPPKDAAPTPGGGGAVTIAPGAGGAGTHPIVAQPAPVLKDVKPWTDDEHNMVVSTYKAILQFKKEGHARASVVLSAFGEFMAKHKLDWTGQHGNVSLWSRPDLREQVYKILEIDVPLPKPAEAATPAFDPDAVPE